MADAFASLFEKAQAGDGWAREAVYRLAFQRLRGIASALLLRERPGHTLQPTALVSELFLKLQRWEARILDEDHFFRLSARAMRQVLIDHARVRKTPPVPLEKIPALLATGPGSTESRLSVRLEFDKLRALDSRVADTVWRRSVEGLTIAELAAVQGREPWRVRADYDFGLQWLANRLKRYA